MATVPAVDTPDWVRTLVPIDSPRTVAAGSLATPGPAVYSPTFDTSRYQSVDITITNTGTIQTLVTILMQNTDGTVVSYYRYLVDANGSGAAQSTLTLVLPIVGTQIRFAISNTVKSGALSVDYLIIGSYRQIPAPIILSETTQDNSTGTNVVTMGMSTFITVPAAAAGSNWDIYPQYMQPGLQSIGISTPNNLTGGSFTVSLIDNYSGASYSVNVFTDHTNRIGVNFTFYALSAFHVFIGTSPGFTPALDLRVTVVSPPA